MKRHLTAAGAGCALLFVLSGCGVGGALAGFSPMYAQGGAVGPNLSRIEVANVSGRAGYLLREALDDDLARQRQEPPLYRLALSVKEVRIPRGLRIDNVANRYELQMRVTYALVDLRAGKTVTRGMVKTNVTYDSADQPYAAVAAHQDAQVRSVADASARLRGNLAAYFANPEVFGVSKARNTRGLQDLRPTLNDRLSPRAVEAPSERGDGPDDPDLVDAQAPIAGPDAPLQIPARQ